MDNISDAIENSAPNDGDGNNDGTPDSQQDSVASLPNAVDGSFVTLMAVGPGLTAIPLVDVAALPAPDNTGVEFPIGNLEFTLQGVQPGGQALVTLYIPEDVTFHGYYKLSGNTISSFNYDANTNTGAMIDNENHIIDLWFVDGSRGDFDHVANGVIVDPGGPVTEFTPLILENFISTVESSDLEEGITTSLTAKLEAALTNLNDGEEPNDGAAINQLGAFINEVEAQRGQKIPENMAATLIAQAQAIIDLLSW